jgi:hypothetical protein
MSKEVGSGFLEFIRDCTDLQLIKLQHDLRRIHEDKEYLLEVLKEFSRRSKGNVCMDNGADMVGGGALHRGLGATESLGS